LRFCGSRAGLKGTERVQVIEKMGRKRTRTVEPLPGSGTAQVLVT
jgi:hypothetical protein